MCAMNNPDKHDNLEDTPCHQQATQPQTPPHSDSAQQDNTESGAAEPVHYSRSYIVVDRLEDNALAVIETDEGEVFTLPQSLLPAGVADGDVLRVERSDDGQRLLLVRDEVARANTQARLQALRDKLRARSRLNQEEDIEL